MFTAFFRNFLHDYFNHIFLLEKPLNANISDIFLVDNKLRNNCTPRE